MVSEISPSKDIAACLCERDKERCFPPPFTELCFDVHIISDPLVPGLHTLDSVGSLEFTAKFGRPLFYSTLNVIKPRMRLMIKLSTIAILSARLLLDLSPGAPSARKYEENMVQSHLRSLYSVSRDEQAMATGSSPEPLIAKAAAQFMNYPFTYDYVAQKYMPVWGMLVKFVDEGLAPQGSVGKLIGRVFSIQAMDRAINALQEHRELKYQTPVTVTAYYKAILTDDAWDKLRRSVPANGAKLSEKDATTTFEVAFANAYFHFSHYAKAHDSAPMKNFYLWALWLRGTAVLCQHNQELSDRILPIYFSSPAGEKGVSPTSVSLTAEKDMIGASANPVTVGTQSAEILGVFTQGNKQPYIAAVRCYALTDNEGMSVMVRSGYDLQHCNDDEAEAPRYQIDFRGLVLYRSRSRQIFDK